MEKHVNGVSWYVSSFTKVNEIKRLYFRGHPALEKYARMPNGELLGIKTLYDGEIEEQAKRDNLNPDSEIVLDRIIKKLSELTSLRYQGMSICAPTQWPIKREDGSQLYFPTIYFPVFNQFWNSYIDVNRVAVMRNGKFVPLTWEKYINAVDNSAMPGWLSKPASSSVDLRCAYLSKTGHKKMTSGKKVPLSNVVEIMHFETHELGLSSFDSMKIPMSLGENHMPLGITHHNTSFSSRPMSFAEIIARCKACEIRYVCPIGTKSMFTSSLDEFMFSEHLSDTI